jgi:hypothetical protein
MGFFTANFFECSSVAVQLYYCKYMYKGFDWAQNCRIDKFFGVICCDVLAGITFSACVNVHCDVCQFVFYLDSSVHRGNQKYVQNTLARSKFAV